MFFQSLHCTLYRRIKISSFAGYPFVLAPRHFGTVVEGPFNGFQIFTMLSLGKILHFLTDSTKFLFARLTFIQELFLKHRVLYNVVYFLVNQWWIVPIHYCLRGDELVHNCFKLSFPLNPSLVDVPRVWKMN